MTQTMIEQLTHEEYCHMLSYGDPKITDPEQIAYEWALMGYDNESHSQQDGNESAWISTLESTTYPGMTFGYIATL